MMPRLSDFSPSDVTWVFDCFDRWDRCLGWSTHGRSLSPMHVEQRLSARQIALQKVARTPAGDPVGVLQVAQVDRRNGHAYLTLLLDGEQRDLTRRSIAQFLTLAFRDLPLRMLYLGAPADDLAVMDHVGTVAQEIGRLREHERRGPGDHVDALMYEILAKEFEKLGDGH